MGRRTGSVYSGTARTGNWLKYRGPAVKIACIMGNIIIAPQYVLSGNSQHGARSVYGDVLQDK